MIEIEVRPSDSVRWCLAMARKCTSVFVLLALIVVSKAVAIDKVSQETTESSTDQTTISTVVPTSSTTVSGNEERPEVRAGDDDDDDIPEGHVAVRTVLDCVLAADWTCVQVKTMRAFRLMFQMGTVEDSDPADEVEQDKVKPATERVAESKVGDDDYDEDSSDEDSSNEDAQDEDDEEGEAQEESTSSGGASESGASFLDQLAEVLVDGVSTIFLSDSEEDRGSRALDRNSDLATVTGRGKLKKRGDHHGIHELVATLMMLKSALMSILTGFAALMQVKSFGITVLGVAISAFRLFMELRKKPHPAPVFKIVQHHQPLHDTLNQEYHASAYPLFNHEDLAAAQALYAQHYPQELTAAHDRVYTVRPPATKVRKPAAPVLTHAMLSALMPRRTVKKPETQPQQVPQGVHLIPNKN